MPYINTNTNTYPLTERDIRAAHSNVSFPSPFRAPEGYEWVFPTPQPTPSNSVLQRVREIAPTISSKGQWEQRWEVVDSFSDYTDDEGVLHTKAEQEAAALAQRDAEQSQVIRTDRNKRLADCDWTQVADAPVDKAAWAAYRQALRDITTQAGFPWTVTWPEQP